MLGYAISLALSLFIIILPILLHFGLFFLLTFFFFCRLEISFSVMNDPVSFINAQTTHSNNAHIFHFIFINTIATHISLVFFYLIRYFTLYSPFILFNLRNFFSPSVRLPAALKKILRII